MSKRLSEAAKLYLNDFDVLNEAHQDVLKLFNSVWKACIGEVNGKEGEETLKPKDIDGRKVWEQWSKDPTSGWQGKIYLYFQNQYGFPLWQRTPLGLGPSGEVLL